MNKQTIKDVDWQGKKALVRVDFNVPLDDDGGITDDARIQAALPTINYLLDHGASVILMSHLGRPKGSPDPKYSLKPVADYLATLVDAPVTFVAATTGADAESAAAALEPGQVLVLENTRFDARETKNEPSMGAELAALGDVFVNDAFGTAHRAHASTAGVTEHLPAVGGFLMEKELNYLGGALDKPVRPFVAILGGAKVSDKIAVIEALLEKVDVILIGGGMANTFLAAEGYDMGDSLVEQDALDTAARSDEEGRRHHPVAGGPARRQRLRSRCGQPSRQRAGRARPHGWRWTSARRPSRTIRTGCRAPRPSSGTGPWACSSSRSSHKARSPSPKSWLTCPTPRPWWAAATARPLSVRPVCLIRSAMSAPGAARAWNSWKARNCPAWPP